MLTVNMLLFLYADKDLAWFIWQHWSRGTSLYFLDHGCPYLLDFHLFISDLISSLLYFILLKIHFILSPCSIFLSRFLSSWLETRRISSQDLRPWHQSSFGSPKLAHSSLVEGYIRIPCASRGISYISLRFCGVSDFVQFAYRSTNSSWIKSLMPQG